MVSLYSNNDIGNQFISLVEKANTEIILACNAFFDTACLNKIHEKLRKGIIFQSLMIFIPLTSGCYPNMELKFIFGIK